MMKQGRYMSQSMGFGDAARDCRKLVRECGISIVINVENRRNNYYNTQIISAKTDNKEIFSLHTVTDEIGASYKLCYDGDDYTPKNLYQMIKAKSLCRFLNRKAKRYNNKLAEYLQR